MSAASSLLAVQMIVRNARARWWREASPLARLPGVKPMPNATEDFHKLSLATGGTGARYPASTPYTRRLAIFDELMQAADACDLSDEGMAEPESPYAARRGLDDATACFTAADPGGENGST